jgi:hypothetical protein
MVTLDLRDPIISLHASTGMIPYCKISNCEDQYNEHQDTAFIIENARDQYWFGCPDETQRESWIRDIGKQIVASCPDEWKGKIEPVEAVMKQGWLTKSAEKENSFMKKRYHVHTVTKMKYYDKPRGKFKGAYLLAESWVRVNDSDSKSKLAGFDIVTPSRTYFLKADSVDERSAWMESLSECDDVFVEQ